AEGVARFVALVADLERARMKVRDLQLAGMQEQRTYDHLVATLGDDLVRYRARREGDAEDVDTLRAQLKSLERRLGEFRDAERAIDDAHRALQRIDRDLATLDAQVATLYRDAGLATDDRETLLARCERVDAHGELSKRRDEA